MLKPQDIMMLLKILSIMTLSKEGHSLEELTQNELARLLCISPSEVNAGIKRLVFSGLLGPVQRSNRFIFLPIKAAVEECLVVGIRYFFPVQLGAYTRGIVTSYAAPIFEKLIVLGDDPVPVWPSGEGNQRGLALEPLYRSVPQSIIKHPDQLFYEMLVLIDAIRIGRARERNIAIKLLKEKIHAE
jgi:hypothetical protein